MAKKAKISTKPDMEAFRALIEEFKNESDRAVVILGVARLDTLLYQLLVKVLLPSVTSDDDLFNGEGPLSTFNAKISMAYRLGLIDDDFVHTLHLVRKIRNRFAHEVTGCKLDYGSHRDRVKELVAPFARHEDFDEAKKVFFGEEESPSIDFRTALAIMELRLEWAINVANPLNRSNAICLIPHQWLQPSEKTEENNAK